MGAAEVTAFLSELARARHVSASTQNQALAALLFLYREVLKEPLSVGAHDRRAKRAQRMPTVLSVEEVSRVLEAMRGTTQLMASLLHGSGLRLMECCMMRAKDVDLARGEIAVRSGKGQTDRVTVLPDASADGLRAQLKRVRRVHALDVAAGGGFVALPYALNRKLGREAGRALAWQWVFPATRPYRDEATGERRAASGGDTTCMRPCYSGQWQRRRRWQG